MKYQQFFIGFFFFVFASSFGQRTKEWSDKAVASKDSANYYFKLAKKAIKNQADEVVYYTSKNLHFTNRNQLDSAIVYGNIAIKKLKTTTANTTLFNLYLDVSESYRKQGQYDKAIDLILEGLKIAESKSDIFMMAKFNMMLSLNYHDFESFKKGVFYGKKAFYYIQIAKQKDVKVIAKIINAIAINYDDWNKADSALYYHYKVFDYVKGNDTLLISRTYNNIGNTLLKQKKYLEARKWVKIGISISETNYKKIDNEKDLNIYYYENATHYNNLATIAYQLNEFSEAEKLFDQSFYFATKSKSAEKMRDYYQHRYLFNRKRNNLKETAKYQDKYISLRDSVFDIERARNFAELETKYQTEKKEKELLKSKALALETETEIKKKNFQFILLFIFIFGMVLIAYLIYRQQKLKHRQQEQEFDLKTAISHIETQNKLQEQRLNISRDLHDNIGSQLTFIISSVDNVKYAFDIDNPKLDDKLTNISSFAKETIVELRDTIWAMNSNEITFEDLESRIHNFIEKAKEAKDKIQFSFQTDADLKNRKLSSIEGMNIYRTIQEAVNNAMKYAKASTISIGVKKLETQIQIMIQDNGIGFDEATIQKGNGLQNMQKRIEDIDGIFSLLSSNNGTVISIVIKNGPVHFKEY
jgi:signal transduction histidine kinase